MDIERFIDTPLFYDGEIINQFIPQEYKGFAQVLEEKEWVPDFKNLEGDIQVTMSVKRYPQESDTVTALSPFTITTSTTKIDTRTRGRFANIKIENDGISEDWRFGTIRLDLQPDGRR